MKNINGKNRRSERGGAGLKLVFVLTILFLIGNALINYIPTAYAGASFREDMQTAVVQGTALPNGNDPVGATKARIRRMLSINSDIPQDAYIEVKQVNSVIQARVAYSKQISILPFGLYNYQYHFDHTATPTGFLLKQ
jgi:hypothetical protein